MDKTLVFPLLIAVLSGLLVALQSLWNGMVGRSLGAFNTGLLSILAGGIAALVILSFIAFRNGLTLETIKGSVWLLLGAGILGVLILTGIAFVVQKVGVTAGLGGVILGQLALGVVFDLLGVGGAVIALDFRRAVGLLFLAIGVFLLLPKT